MKKTRKGVTLVEVIVSIAVFTIISLALFSSVLSMRKVVLRQEEYARLEMVCYDINAYWDAYGENWYNNYTKGVSSGKFIYLDSDFKVTDAVNQVYTLKYDYDGKGTSETSDDELIIIFIKKGDYTYAENINCGVSQ
ncbi:MAG: type II secretion system protein J [Eubacteriales bacterium]